MTARVVRVHLTLYSIRFGGRDVAVMQYVYVCCGLSIYEKNLPLALDSMIDKPLLTLYEEERGYIYDE